MKHPLDPTSLAVIVEKATDSSHRFPYPVPAFLDVTRNTDWKNFCYLAMVSDSPVKSAPSSHGGRHLGIQIVPLAVTAYAMQHGSPMFTT